jgi:hypothetical protein
MWTDTQNLLFIVCISASAYKFSLGNIISAIVKDIHRIFNIGRCTERDEVSNQFRIFYLPMSCLISNKLKYSNTHYNFICSFVCVKVGL